MYPIYLPPIEVAEEQMEALAKEEAVIKLFKLRFQPWPGNYTTAKLTRTIVKKASGVPLIFRNKVELIQPHYQETDYWRQKFADREGECHRSHSYITWGENTRHLTQEHVQQNQYDPEEVRKAMSEFNAENENEVEDAIKQFLTVISQDLRNEGFIEGEMDTDEVAHVIASRFQEES